MMVAASFVSLFAQRADDKLARMSWGGTNQRCNRRAVSSAGKHQQSTSFNGRCCAFTEVNPAVNQEVDSMPRYIDRFNR